MRGPVGSPVSNPALEITSSAYVSHSAEILYRNAYATSTRKWSPQGHFYTNIHSEGLNRPEDLPNARVFMDRSHRTTYSFNCTYAGNTLLLKKGNHRFPWTRRSMKSGAGTGRAHVHHRHRRTRRPHHLVTGAAPSGCGKTTTAMAGNHFVGDDLAQMWIAEDGSIRSVNPECGIFGIVEDVNWEGDPMLMDCLRNPGTKSSGPTCSSTTTGCPIGWATANPPRQRDAIFKAPGRRLTDADGKPSPYPIPTPAARWPPPPWQLFGKAEDPAGVETRVITYSGRDSDTMPPVWAAKNADQGVAIGACIVSAATATEVGATGVKRAPWANAPLFPARWATTWMPSSNFSAVPDCGGQTARDGRPELLSHPRRRAAVKAKLLGEKRDVKVWLAWLERLRTASEGPSKPPSGLTEKRNIFPISFFRYSRSRKRAFWHYGKHMGRL
jgi:phosphoenolpyruvate carboxykinase (GTP)